MEFKKNIFIFFSSKRDKTCEASNIIIEEEEIFEKNRKHMYKNSQKKKHFYIRKITLVGNWKKKKIGEVTLEKYSNKHKTHFVYEEFN